MSQDSADTPGLQVDSCPAHRPDRRVQRRHDRDHPRPGCVESKRVAVQATATKHRVFYFAFFLLHRTAGILVKRPRGLLPDSCYGVEILLKTEKKRGNSKFEMRKAQFGFGLRNSTFASPNFAFRISHFEFPHFFSN